MFAVGLKVLLGVCRKERGGGIEQMFFFFSSVVV